MRTENGINLVQCPRCFGRGYQPESRRTGGGFYARTCPRCGGSGEIPEPPSRVAVSTEIKRGSLPQGYALAASDVGRPLTGPSEGFGKVQRIDVGKRCYRRDGCFSMENAAQRDARPVRSLPTIGDPAAYVQDGRTHLPPDSE